MHVCVRLRSKESCSSAVSRSLRPSFSVSSSTAIIRHGGRCTSDTSIRSLHSARLGAQARAQALLVPGLRQSGRRWRLLRGPRRRQKVLVPSLRKRVPNGRLLSQARRRRALSGGRLRQGRRWQGALSRTRRREALSERELPQGGRRRRLLHCPRWWQALHRAWVYQDRPGWRQVSRTRRSQALSPRELRADSPRRVGTVSRPRRRQDLLGCQLQTPRAREQRYAVHDVCKGAQIHYW